jgi:hypothetical protein
MLEWRTKRGRAAPTMPGARPAIPYPRQVPPFQTPAGETCMPTDLRQPGRLPLPDPGIPKKADAGYYLRRTEPRGLCVSRSLGICPYRCLTLVSAWATNRPRNHTMPRIQPSRMRTQYWTPHSRRGRHRALLRKCRAFPCPSRRTRRHSLQGNARVFATSPERALDKRTGY